MENPVVWFDIVGKDGEALKKFYGDVFKWEINSDNPMNYGMVNTEGKDKIGGGIGSSPNGKPMAIFYIAVKDIKEHLKIIESKGGKVIMPFTVIPDMVTMAMFSDPEGNIIGLVE
jgi:predicted enzyme related to lactoylglutathione lyase